MSEEKEQIRRTRHRWN